MGDLIIHFKKKDLFLITAIFIFIVGSGIIIAYNPGGTATPSVLGHSMNEIDSSTCANGDNMMKINGVWSCNVSSIIPPGIGYDGKTGTEVCQLIGKKCIAVIAYPYIANYVRGGSNGCDSSVTQLTKCMDVCLSINSIYSCNQQVGDLITHLDLGVVACNAKFSAICD